jgi:hypothetical protein
MGASWVGVREAVTAGPLRSSDKGAAEVASRWDQLIRYACLRLGKQLGVEVQPVLSRKELAEPSIRSQALVASLVKDGTLSGVLRIPNTVGPITITADLRAGRVTTSIDVEAPKTGRSQTRINWLLRQLREAPDAARIDCWAARARGRQPRSCSRQLGRTRRC